MECTFILNILNKNLYVCHYHIFDVLWDSCRTCAHCDQSPCQQASDIIIFSEIGSSFRLVLPYILALFNEANLSESVHKKP